MVEKLGEPFRVTLAPSEVEEEKHLQEDHPKGEHVA
jgi:hypothetical protein